MSKPFKEGDKVVFRSVRQGEARKPIQFSDVVGTIVEANYFNCVVRWTKKQVHREKYTELMRVTDKQIAMVICKEVTNRIRRSAI